MVLFIDRLLLDFVNCTLEDSSSLHANSAV